MSDYPPPPPGSWAPGPSPDLPSDQLAPWISRVGATLIDTLIGFGIWLAGTILGAVLGTASDALGAIMVVAGNLGSFVFSIWNLVLQGRTGQTIGKRTVGIRLVRLDGVAPPGAWFSIGRSIVHILDALPCYLGFLWPLWDKRRQTFADKILNTVVVTG